MNSSNEVGSPIESAANTLPNLQDFEEIKVLSVEQAQQLQMLCLEFQTTRARMARDFVLLTQVVSSMADLLGDDFESFAKRALGLTYSATRRYLHAHRILQRHFSNGGRIEFSVASQLTQRAFSLLSDDTPENVIEQIREAAGRGEKVNEQVIIELIDNRSELERRAASATAEAETQRQRAEEIKEQAEAKEARLRDQLRRAEEVARRSEGIEQDLRREIEELTKQSTLVSTVEKEVPPAGYVSNEAAIAESKAKLDEAIRKKEEAEKAAQVANDELQRSRQELENYTNQTHALTEIKKCVDEVVAKIPSLLTVLVDSKDSACRILQNQIAESLIYAGTTLAEAK